MSLRAGDFEEGVRTYWREIESRSHEVQEREQSFPDLANRFAARQPPHFTPSDLEHIIRWKYTDGRRRNRALDGLARVPDDRLRDITASLHRVTEATEAARGLRAAIGGVGISGISTILAAGRPDLFPVIDVFALTAICHYYDPPWPRRSRVTPTAGSKPMKGAMAPTRSSAVNVPRSCLSQPVSRGHRDA